MALPQPGDELFAHLPQGLRTLALPSCPHKCVKEWLWACEGRYSWFPHTFHLLTALDLLGVLERCLTRELTRLEIEYGADERECDLLRYLVIASPGLFSLTLYRYRRREEAVVCVVSSPVVSLSALITEEHCCISGGRCLSVRAAKAPADLFHPSGPRDKTKEDSRALDERRGYRDVRR